MYKISVEKILEIRKKLSRKKLVTSAWMQLSNSNLTELMCSAKFDCVTFDFEHGLFSVKDLPDLFRVLEQNRKLPLIRLPNKNIDIAAQCLDAGSGGLIIPNIQNSQELKKIIERSYLPPEGKRGVGFSRSNRFGKNFNLYIKNKTKPLIIAMIESKLAVKNIDSILQTKGLDAILIVPYDLSASYNIVEKIKKFIFKNILKKIKNSCKKYKIACGVHVIEPTTKNLNYHKKQGFTFLPYGIDTDILNRAINKLF